MKTQTNISKESQEVLQIIQDHNNNWSPCYIEDVVEYANLTKSQIKGHITDLRNKKLITPHDPDCGELHTWDNL